MAIENLLVYQDLIDRLVAYTGGGSLDPDHPDILWAIQEAYADVTHATDWCYLNSKGRIVLNGAYSTGTVAFDLTGGAYERVLTLSGGTWPTWAAYGTVKIDGKLYSVDERKSTTQLTLTADQCPVDDVAALTTYVLFQSSYPLPSTFRRLSELFMDGETHRIREISPNEWLAYETMQATAGRPEFFSIVGSPDTLESLSLQLAPYPDQAYTLVFMFDRTARPLFYRGYESEARSGSVSGSAASTTVTGSSSTFHAAMVGSIIRFSRDTTNFPKGKAALHTFREQQQIRAVASTTSLTVGASLAYTHASGTKYTISDPIDLPQSMYQMLLRGCESYLDASRNSKLARESERRYRLAQVQARERDVRTRGGNSPFTEYVWANGWDGALLPGVG